MILTLIGTRGTGKTTVAPLLAARLGWKWIDADVELERRAGRTIREIFATDGEPVFRQLERDNLINLLKQDRLVLAAGGGAILNADTRQDFRAAGPVVWLQASPETVAARVMADPVTASRRPNLTPTGGVGEFRTILQQREPWYRETASICIVTDDRTEEQIVSDILDQLPPLSPRGAAE